MRSVAGKIKELLKRAVRSTGYEIRWIPPAPTQDFVIEKTDFEYELLRGFATRAAEFAASPGETRAVRHLYLTGVLGPGPAFESGHIAVGGAGTLNVGIWRRERPAADVPFIRRPDARSEWFSWADKNSIEPKRGKWRVLLVGESVARSYLYDPQFNLSAALQRVLQMELGAAQIDVIDLAKSNLTLDQLKVLLGQSLALQPDVIVVFAGNNWRPHVFEPDIPYIDTLLRGHGAPAMKSFLDVRTSQSADLLIRQINEILAQHKNLSVIWVVPEFNLADWADPLSNAPHLPGDGDMRWRELDQRAQRAFSAHDLAQAERLAIEMTQLDGGTSSAPLRILVQCRRAAADVGETRRYLELCRDAEGWDPSFSYSPRVCAAIQSALRGASAFARNGVVDLPVILDRHLEGGLPDRRVFLDYCHLTAEGIRIATGAIASEVVKALTGRAVPAGALDRHFVAPSPQIEGKACFLAAVHNAHFYQSYEVVRYWCARALEQWPESAELMTRFVDAQSRRAPLVASKATIELYQLDRLGTLEYLLRGGQQRLELVLGDAIVDCLRQRGLQTGRNLAALRLQEHSVRTGPKELTDFYYSSAVPGAWTRAWTSSSLPKNGGSRSLFASAYWETSKFIFFGEKGRSIGIRLTYRLPGPCAPDAAIEISVNGHRAGRSSAAPDWRTFEISMSGDHILEGINEIVVTWPEETGRPQDALGQLADAVVARQLPRFHRVFGEIHSLVVFDADNVPQWSSLRSADS